MKLYLAPGACSLADHIALREAGMAPDLVKVDLAAKLTEHGDDYAAINPKGYVPALALDDGQVLTENVAILSWVADQAPQLAPAGDLARIRLIEMLAYITTELHKPLVRCMFPTGDAEKAAATALAGRRLGFVATKLQGDYLFGSAFSVADAYLYVMLRWVGALGLDMPAPLAAYRDRVEARPGVQRALRDEGLA